MPKRTAARSAATNGHAGPLRSLADEAYHGLRLAIVECRLPPGERITEAAVAERMKVGKMPAREALRRLVGEGLMDVIPRHGYAVAPITLRAVRELFELRLIVEPAAAERAAGHLTPEDVAALGKLGDLTYRPDDRDSMRRYLRANTSFHTKLSYLSGNRMLGDVVAKALAESERLINFTLTAYPQTPMFASQHRQLLKALARGEASQARRIAAAHIEATRDMVIEQVLSHQAFGEMPIGG